MNQKEIEQLNIEIFNKITSSASADEFNDYYFTHTRKETLEHYGIRTEKQLLKILTVFKYDFSQQKPSPMKGKQSNRSHESYVSGGQKSANTQKQNWLNKSDEEKESWSIKQSIAHLNSPTFRDKITQSNRSYRSSLTQEERDELDKRRSETMKTWWENLSQEEQSRIMANRFKNGVSYSQKNSRPNLEFCELLNENNIEYKREVCFDSKFFDFKVNNILIEIDPTITHNSTYTPFKYNEPRKKSYHLDKTNTAKKYGFRCIHLFDWDDKHKLINLLSSNRESIYARECKIKGVSKQDAIDFISTFHLQGYAQDSIRLGLYYNDELVSIMTFGKPRYNKNYEYELIRYCTSKNITGGAEKLLKHFIIQYNVKSLISYCDLSKFSGQTYEKLGFTLLRTSGPAKHWYNIRTKEHYTDNLLRQRGFSQLIHNKTAEEDGLVGESNSELMIASGFVEIYDCGQATYVLKKEE